MISAVSTFGRLASGSNSDLLNLCAPPPIEELIATHAAMTQLSAHFGRAGGDGFDWPLLVRAAMRAARDGVAVGTRIDGEDRPNPEFASPFEYVGELVSEYSSVGAMFELVAQISDGVPQLGVELSVSGLNRCWRGSRPLKRPRREAVGLRWCV